LGAALPAWCAVEWNRCPRRSELYRDHDIWGKLGNGHLQHCYAASGEGASGLGFRSSHAIKRLLDVTRQPDERSQIVDRLKEIKGRAAEYALLEVGYVEDDLEKFASPLRSADIHAGSMAAEIRAARGGSAEFLKYLRAIKRP
jgi:hypothetical protein